ncbi:hypothetical protein EMIHUDRAFT_455093 [Emiliania huxleyi CCMP1516]|uniref:H/ACA ribonucleoprotein complex subunit 2 n=3 Tax=Emiliania huxleyi TaxID=2903 RepID=A0A0D3KKY1_EMIH1|nr:hypothetical protein EMIHUDRAFT_455093 [Emiliania huxleyi CCMP1516]EOD36416.1 hypothetical protein EMIHUDRAFT_455093 [Emiliania huxleyi CCMP1516]|eukprot:XP_005788845.1 hypothetical protein EMIHUDRAFT_455093 [Emiliania huxleyi CCMP1516]
MGKKDKSEKKKEVEDDDDAEDGSKKQVFLSPIASPLAGKKLTKKALKCIKKASGAKTLRRGVKEVVKALKKDTKGLCIIAGNISPIDVIAHVPILCEEKAVPYCYVPSKEELGQASLTKRPTSIVLVTCAADFKEAYEELSAEMAALAPASS